MSNCKSVALQVYQEDIDALKVLLWPTTVDYSGLAINSKRLFSALRARGMDKAVGITKKQQELLVSLVECFDTRVQTVHTKKQYPLLIILDDGIPVHGKEP